MTTQAPPPLVDRIIECLAAGYEPVETTAILLLEDGRTLDEAAKAETTVEAMQAAGHTTVCAVRAALTPEETEGPACVCPGGLKQIALAGEMLP